MRHRFLYFIPGVPGCSEQLLLKAGLYDRFVGADNKLAGWIVREEPHGPNGQSGCIVASGQRPPEYSDDVRQKWIEVLNINCPVRYWVGIENVATPPGPEDLMLPFNIRGHFVKLGDENRWRIPMVWSWNLNQIRHELALPQKMSVHIEDSKKVLKREVMAVYRPLIQIAERVWDSFTNETPISSEQVFLDCVVLLAANYRVGLEEISLLGLFDEESLQEILKASIDYPTLSAQAAEMAASGLLQCEQKPDLDEMSASQELPNEQS